MSSLLFANLFRLLLVRGELRAWTLAQKDP
jgi:hypothetical protein